MSTIQISNITSVTSTDGTGVFDILMEAVNLQILKQYQAERITGTDYANVYLAAMQTVLQQSVQFSLQAETAGLQADEVRAGTVRNNAESDKAVQLTQEKIETEDKNNKEGGVIDKQIEKLESEKLLVDEKIATEKTNTEDATGGAAKDKSTLMNAQALGFANNTRQALIKTMLDGYSTNLAIAGSATAPESTKNVAIDDLKADILATL